MIIKLYEINKEQETLIYEYFPSVNLRERLKNNQKISYMSLINIFKQLALAIDFLHSKNIAHIDINDTNFLINKQLKVKLNDYDFIEILTIENQALKKIDILSFATLIFRIIQLPYKHQAIKHLTFVFNVDNLNYDSCDCFLNSLKLL